MYKFQTFSWNSVIELLANGASSFVWGSLDEREISDRRKEGGLYKVDYGNGWPCAKKPTTLTLVKAKRESSHSCVAKKCCSIAALNGKKCTAKESQ